MFLPCDLLYTCKISIARDLLSRSLFSHLIVIHSVDRYSLAK